MNKLSVLRVAGFLLAALSGLALLLCGPGYRFEIWNLPVAFALLKYAAYGGLVAAVICALGLAFARPRGAWLALAALGMAIGAATVWIPWQQLQTVKRLPLIHDITTDTADPPAFLAVLPLRAAALNSAAYAGAELAAQQKKAYPDIQPLVVALPPGVVFARALAAVEALGWKKVAADPATGRIEATDTTFWFGFQDDVVVRITPLESSSSRVDVRSVSRLGQSDLGANAQRIRRFLAAVQDASQ